MINLIVFASSHYPLPVLEALKNDGQFKISLIITRPDRPLGRKQTISPNPVKVWANRNNIEVSSPENFTENNLNLLKEKIELIKPELGLVAHFGLKIPKVLFLLPKKETLNIHFSLLPKYRGGAPLEYTIINGDIETGITFLKLTEDFDTGEIVYQEKIPLIGKETVDSLYKSLFEKTAFLLPQILKDYIEGKIEPKKQDESKVVNALKKDLGDGKIDWQKKPEELERFIRALNPNPGTYTYIKINGNNTRLKILKTHLENKKLILDEVQLEGKTPVSFNQFQKSYPTISLNTLIGV